MIIKLGQEFLGYMVDFDTDSRVGTVVEVTNPLSRLFEVGDTIENIKHLAEDYTPVSVEDKLHWEIFLKSEEQSLEEKCDYCQGYSEIHKSHSLSVNVDAENKWLEIDVSIEYEGLQELVNIMYCPSCGRKL